MSQPAQQQQHHSNESSSSSSSSPLQPKTTVSAPIDGDSGFLSCASLDPPSAQLSGPQAPVSPPSTAVPAGDSGLCADVDDDDDESGEMLVDASSGSGEWSAGAKSGRNNLSKTTSAAATAKPTVDVDPMRLKDYMDLWKVCYMQDENGDTQLHLSILSKLAKAIGNIIRLAPQTRLLDLRNDDGQSGMHFAVLTRQPHVIRQLRAAGAKASLRDHCGNTPLHLACINNDLGCVQALTNPIGPDEMRAFAYAERIPLLPADTKLVNYDGEYCVHIAAQRGHLDILRHLVHNCQADLNVREGRAGYTALHYACENQNAPLRDFLLNECPGRLSLETCTYGRRTAHQLAAMLDDGRTMDALRRAGAEPLEPMTDDDEDSDDEDDGGEFASEDDLSFYQPDAGMAAVAVQ